MYIQIGFNIIINFIEDFLEGLEVFGVLHYPQNTSTNFQFLRSFSKVIDGFLIQKEQRDMNQSSSQQICEKETKNNVCKYPCPYSFVSCNAECPRDWDSSTTTHGNAIQDSHLHGHQSWTNK